MSNRTKLDISSIIGIREGIHQVFSLFEQNLDFHQKHPDKTDLIRDCRNYIYQLDKLLAMLGLTSIAIISKKMVQLVDALVTRKIELNAEICDALRQSNKSLLHYLDEIAGGAEEDPVRLFPAYRELMHVYGSEHAPESDLFFPHLTADPALKTGSVFENAAVAQTLARTIGAEYQAGLLKWLRDPSNKDGLQQMADAINRLEEFPGAVEERAFWWVVSGFLEDLLQRKGAQINLTERRLCGKIEQAIRHLVAKAIGSTASLHRELIFQIAQSELDSPRIAAIKHCYTWRDQATGFDGLKFKPSKVIQPVLSLLQQTSDLWCGYCAGQSENLVPLSENIVQLEQLAQQTQCPPLEKLIEAVGSATAHLYRYTSPQIVDEELAVKMPDAFLLIENIIHTIDRPLSTDLLQQINLLTSSLQQIAAKNSGMQGEELLQQATQDMLTNLGQIENILDQFFFEPDRHPDLSMLSTLFQQISDDLVMLGLEQADSLLHCCQAETDKMLEQDHSPVETEQALLITGLNNLSTYIRSLKNGQSDDHTLIEETLVLFQATANPENALPAQSNPDHPNQEAPEMLPTAAVTDEVDPELLDIFLEEASEVLISIATSLQQCRTDPADDEALIGLRRGFCTLKSIGRVIRWNEMSGTAQQIEQILNDWITKKISVSQHAIKLIDRIHQTYTAWCTNYREHGMAEAETYVHELSLVIKALAFAKEIAGTETAAPVTETLTASPAANPESPEIVKLELSATETINHIDSSQPFVFFDDVRDIIQEISVTLHAWDALPQDRNIQQTLLNLLNTLKQRTHSAGAAYFDELIQNMVFRIEAAFHQNNRSEFLLDQLENDLTVISSKVTQLQSAEIPRIAITQNINSDVIEKLVEDITEAGILQSSIETQFKNFKQPLQHLKQNVLHLHDQLHDVEVLVETQLQSQLLQPQDSQTIFAYDRIAHLRETARSMMENIENAIMVHKDLHVTHNVTEEIIMRQSAINQQLQRSAQLIHAIPFGNYTKRYGRLVRQLAKDMDKKANLKIRKAKVGIDPGVMKSINPALEHLLHNAVFHGIEKPLQRLQSGKPETGEINLHLQQHDSEVIITLSDDGSGLNLPRIREEAHRLGLIQKNEILDDDQVMLLIFAQGLSTAESIPGSADHGAGLENTRNVITALGGRIDVHSISGQGTTFTIHLPLVPAGTYAQPVDTGMENASARTKSKVIPMLKPKKTARRSSTQKNFL